MSNIKIVPCLVFDKNGSTKVGLEKGSAAFFQNPDWHCNNVKCPIRGNFLKDSDLVTVYDPLKVWLGNVGNIHGVIRCQGGGRVERSS